MTVRPRRLDTEMLLHRRGGGAAHAWRAGDLLERRRLDLLQAAEVPEQLALALGADPRDVLERRAQRALLAQLAVELVGEAMRFVADARQEEELRRVGPQLQRVLDVLEEDAIGLLV